MSTDLDGASPAGPDEPELDRQIRAHFVAARQATDVPGFESVMVRAEAADVAASGTAFSWFTERFEGWSIRWAGALAAAAGMAFALLLVLQSGEQSITDEAARIAQHEAMRTAADDQLLASLERTTRWQAPSDRWLAVETDSPEVLKEKSTWL